MEKMSFKNALLMGLLGIRKDLYSNPPTADAKLKTMIDMISLMTEDVDKKTIRLKEVI